ncbi:MAG TPA: shikimate kinase AroK [Thiotrichaceae bacterium]|nr:shikimate kinase AroK [Thiotrichaceae bacterium]
MSHLTNLTNIFLVGPMGVGKTTIGHRVADILERTFIDSDHEIEERTGATIPLIFEYEGESGFRKREQAIIAELTAHQNIVLSTGGGVVLNAHNRHHLHSRGYVIYLQASVEDLLERTAHCRHRPLLQTENPRERLETLLKERHSLYTAVADITIETGHRTIRQVVKAVLRHLKKIEYTT